MLEKELVCAIFENESDEKHLHIHPEIRRAGLLLLLKKQKWALQFVETEGEVIKIKLFGFAEKIFITIFSITLQCK